MRLPLLLALWLLAPAALAAPLDAAFTDAELRRTGASVLSIADGRVRFVDADRNVNDASLRGVVRLRFPAPDVAPAGSGLLTLTDCQALAGEPAREAGATPETLAWRHPVLGVCAVPLERVAALAMPGKRNPFPEPEDSLPADLLRLANGDALSGFIAGVDAEGVTLEPDGGAAAAIPWSAVAGVRLANPASPPPAGSLVRLRDGSVFTSATVRFDGDAWTLETALADGGPVGFSADAVAELQPAASALRLLDLGSVRFEEPVPAEAFGLAFPAHRGPEGLRLHAPTQLHLAAPGAQDGETLRRARLVLSLTPEAAVSPLASVDAAVGDAEPVRLDAERSTAVLEAGSLGSPLRLVLGEAEHGPVLDRVILEEAEILIEAPAGDSP